MYDAAVRGGRLFRKGEGVGKEQGPQARRRSRRCGQSPHKPPGGRLGLRPYPAPCCNLHLQLFCGRGTIATLASRILGAVIMLYKLLRPDCRVGMRSFGDLRFQREMFGRILRIGIPSGLESAAFNIGKLLVASLVSTLVTAAITANAVMNTLQSIILIPTSAIHLAAVPIVGQCLGAGKAEDAKYYTKWLVGLAYICLFITAGGTLLFADPILSLFKLTPETTAVALRLLRFYFCIVVTLYPLAFTITPCLRAAGDVRFCLIGAMTGMWLGRILCSHLFVSFGWGIMGVWVAIVADWLIRIAFYLPRYLSGRWLKKKVI